MSTLRGGSPDQFPDRQVQRGDARMRRTKKQRLLYLSACAAMLFLGITVGFVFALFLVAYGVPRPVASTLASTTVMLLFLGGWKKGGKPPRG
jgi:hypothetical protein